MAPAEAKQHRRYTFADYLQAELESDVKHEFHRGNRLEMSAVSFRHLKISGNIQRHLGNRLADGPCDVFNGDARVRQVSKAHYVYPDATVVCGDPEFDENDPSQTTLVNPAIVFEVLSPSTAAYDLGLKFARYRDVPSLQMFVAVAQDQAFAQAFSREKDSWSITAAIGMDDTLKLPAADAAVPLAEVYERVDLPAESIDQRMQREMDEARQRIQEKYDKIREELS